jgi:hypothetical protein
MFVEMWQRHATGRLRKTLRSSPPLGTCRCTSGRIAASPLILVLTLTVFKIKELRLNINKVWLTDISAATGFHVCNYVVFDLSFVHRVWGLYFHAIKKCKRCQNFI